MREPIKAAIKEASKSLSRKILNEYAIADRINQHLDPAIDNLVSEYHEMKGARDYLEKENAKLRAELAASR